MRVVVAGLFHETNTFLDGVTGLKDFEILEGKSLLEVRGSGSPLAGALEVAAQLGWECIPAIDMRATPGPMVEDAALEYFLERLVAVIKTASVNSIDGVMLILHGAMVSQSVQDVEGHVLRSIRKWIGPDVPICGVLDLHANHTSDMAAFSDGLVAYRENPHTDAHDTGVRAAELLHRLMKERIRPRSILMQMPIVWPPTGTATASEPMRTLEKMAREIEQNDPNILTVNILAGFAFADVRDSGVSFSCVTLGDTETANCYLQQLADYAVANRNAGNQIEADLDEVMNLIGTDSRGPILLVEPSDNIGAGTSGRGLGVLKAMLSRRVENAAVVLQGPEQVDAFRNVPIGQRRRIHLVDPFDPEPLDLDVVLCSRSDGRFQLEDPHSHLASMRGTSIDMGDCVVVQTGGVQILLTSKRTPPFDLGQLRSQNIIPEKLSMVGIKAAVAHRRVWDPIAQSSYWVDTPGPCSSNLKRLNYLNLRRPIFPLDPIDERLFSSLVPPVESKATLS